MPESALIIRCLGVFPISLSYTILEEKSDNLVSNKVLLIGKLLRRGQRQKNISIVSRPSQPINVYLFF